MHHADQTSDQLLIPSLALMLMLKQLPTQTQNALLRCSRSVRQELLRRTESLCFTPGVKATGNLSQQLCDVLKERKEPLALTLNMSKGQTHANEMLNLLVEAAGTIRPVRGNGGARMCSVDKLVLQVRSLYDASDAHTCLFLDRSDR